VTGRALPTSVPSAATCRPSDDDLVVLAPTFVALNEEETERAVDALAELLAASSERSREAAP